MLILGGIPYPSAANTQLTRVDSSVVVGFRLFGVESTWAARPFSGENNVVKDTSYCQGAGTGTDICIRN